MKEQWLDKVRYKTVKLEKYIERFNWKKHIIMFQCDQKGLFRTLEALEKRKGEMLEMQRFAEFWGRIWKQNEPMSHMPWMEKVRAKLGKKANLVGEFAITDGNVKKEIAK